MAEGKLERAQLRNLASGLNALHDRLTYHQNLLSPDGKDYDFFCTAPNKIFPGAEEVRLDFESSLVGATDEDRGKVECLLGTLEKLNTATVVYVKLMRELERKKAHKKLDKSKKSLEIELSDTDQEKLLALYNSMPDFFEEGQYDPPSANARVPADINQMHRPQNITDSDTNKYYVPIIIKSTPQNDAPLSDNQVLSGKEDAMPIYEKAILARGNLELHYEMTLHQIDDLRCYLLNQLSAE